VINFFRKKLPALPDKAIHVDIHSHLLPGLDDGVQTYEESLEILKKFESLGYHKVITTPHVMGDIFINSNQDIQDKLMELRDRISHAQLIIKVEAAAEYYLDETLVKRIESQEDFLTFGSNYLLFETSYMNEPIFFHDIIFKLSSLGYRPVLAHPERYLYLQENPEQIEDLINRGLYMQLNVNSLEGYFSLGAKMIARRMVKNRQVNFVGSDCHNLNHLEILEQVIKTRSYKKALKLDLINNSL